LSAPELLFKKEEARKRRTTKGFCPRRSCYLKKKKQEKGAQPKVFVRGKSHKKRQNI
jgi:hypothetical protein